MGHLWRKGYRSSQWIAQQGNQEESRETNCCNLKEYGMKRKEEKIGISMEVWEHSQTEVLMDKTLTIDV